MLTASRWSSEPPFQGFRSEGEASIRCRIFIKEAAAPLVKGAGGFSQRCNIPAHGRSVSVDGALPYDVGSGQEQSAMPCSCQCPAWQRSGVAGWDVWAKMQEAKCGKHNLSWFALDLAKSLLFDKISQN